MNRPSEQSDEEVNPKLQLSRPRPWFQPTFERDSARKHSWFQPDPKLLNSPPIMQADDYKLDADGKVWYDKRLSQGSKHLNTNRENPDLGDYEDVSVRALLKTNVNFHCIGMLTQNFMFIGSKDGKLNLYTVDVLHMKPAGVYYV